MANSQENTKEASSAWISEAREFSATLRGDLTFTRQIYQGRPVYMVHDPVNFKNHRFTKFDYVVAKELRHGKKLGEVFDRLAVQGMIEREDELSFFQFAMKLHSLNLLSLPINNGPELFARSEATTSAERKKKYTSILFIRIPIANPDRFLDRTIHLVRWMFTPAFVAIWAIALLAAIGVLITKRAEFFEPLSGILAAENLPFLWLSLIALKVWHELGHGYLCKHFGGKVPEMGAMFLVGNPAAYVDASSAWAFPTRWRRISVMLGGMFFESIVAIIAIFVWAFSTNPFLSSCAFQIFVMAGFITIFFNANPLMRYDGYFILGELLGIQNLRTQAGKHLNAIWKRIFLGVKTPSNKSRRERGFLIAFAIAAVIYKQVLILTIAFVLSYRFPFIGLALATFHIANTLVSLFSKVTKYLLFDRETREIQWRARTVGLSAICLLVAIVCFVPMPGGVVVTGLTGFEVEHSVRAKHEGFLVKACVKPGQKISAGQVISELDNVEVEDAVVTAMVSYQASQINTSRHFSSDIDEVSRLKPAVENNRNRLLRRAQKEMELSVCSPVSGTVVQSISGNQKGRMIRSGRQLATIVDGQPIVRTWLNEEQLRSIRNESDAKVQVRIHSDPNSTILGSIHLIQPAVKSILGQEAVTQSGGERILVDPISKKPLENLYEVQVRLLNVDPDFVANHIPYGMKTSIRFTRIHESVGHWAYRQVNAFVQKVTTSE